MNIENKHILFVTDEFYPVNNGGIARLLSVTVKELTLKKCNVTILMATEDYNSVMEFQRTNRNEYLRIYSVNELLGNSAYDTIYSSWITSLDRMHQSFRCTLAIRELSNHNNFDLIEFNDCWGLGYVYFKWRKLFKDSFTNVPAWVRIHGTMENCMIADCISNTDIFYPYHYSIFQMEREALKMCDGIISPSNAVAEWYKDYYDIKNVQTVVSVPLFEKLDKNNIHPRKITKTPFKILYYGRVQHLKGVDNLVKAVVNIAAKQGLIIEVTLIGTIVNNYDSYLQKLIPDHLKNNFKFTGLINPQTLSKYVLDADVAVISSRLETFCLAAHELNWLGIPIILNKIPAFTDFFTDNVDCLFYDNTAESLEKSILRFFSENKTQLKNNAVEVSLKHNSEETYHNILKNYKRFELAENYSIFKIDEYVSTFYLLVFGMNMGFNNSVQDTVLSKKNKLKNKSIFEESYYKEASIEELNILILLSHFKIDNSNVNNSQHQDANKIREWYEKEYEVLPIWYKRFGHIIKVVTGKRKFKSLFKK